MSSAPIDLSFTHEALRILNESAHDPEAKASYDIMSGGLHWPDEFPPFAQENFSVVWRGFLPRYVLAYRASLTLGQPQSSIEPLWQQLCEFAPHWPGLRLERRGAAARRRLLAAKRREAKCIEEIEREFDAHR